MPSFKANGYLIGEDSSSIKNVSFENVDGLKAVFGSNPEVRVREISLDKYIRLYYDINRLEGKQNLDGFVLDKSGCKEYFVLPLLVVLCDDTKPIDCTEEVLNKVQEVIDIF